MTAQLTFLDAAQLPRLGDVRLPDDHPIHDLYTADQGFGPRLWWTFESTALQLENEKRRQVVDQMTPDEIAAVWNSLEEHGGSVIRWDAAIGMFTTRNAEVYAMADVRATVMGLLRY